MLDQTRLCVDMRRDVSSLNANADKVYSHDEISPVFYDFLQHSVRRGSEPEKE